MAYHDMDNAPPAYDEVSAGPAAEVQDAKKPTLAQQPPTYTMPGPSNYHAQPVQAMGEPIVYRYQSSVTGETVMSLLPPDHPEMICLQSGHLPHTNYGLLGILAAVFWFPLGVGLCLLDRRVKCTRCSQVIEEGMCK
ncbi:hypothetical protein CYLTODRAFT_420605 [Cylindrobasidium torrendii FP15055 ss-10]|uniref:Brain protein I3 n=1 Tax=Cylindrobasidium torrendii FP15055 ss-10 TaxID=1314674 RepID=A0A0D7BGC0_9AGAR|nr:hypothetical protein CYLTODRAFT_420605 [Cylindrobasidium torrendii FP15055 ss-10]